MLPAATSPEVVAARQQLVLQLRGALAGATNKQLEALFGEGLQVLSFGVQLMRHKGSRNGSENIAILLVLQLRDALAGATNKQLEALFG